MGEISKVLPTKPGARTDLTSHQPGERLKGEILHEAGISVGETIRNEALASIPDEVFEAEIIEVKARNMELTSAGMWKRQCNQIGSQSLVKLISSSVKYTLFPSWDKNIQEATTTDLFVFTPEMIDPYPTHATTRRHTGSQHTPAVMFLRDRQYAT